MSGSTKAPAEDAVVVQTVETFPGQSKNQLVPDQIKQLDTSIDVVNGTEQRLTTQPNTEVNPDLTGKVLQPWDVASFTAELQNLSILGRSNQQNHTWQPNQAPSSVQHAQAVQLTSQELFPLLPVATSQAMSSLGGQETSQNAFISAPSLVGDGLHDRQQVTSIGSDISGLSVLNASTGMRIGVQPHRGNFNPVLSRGTLTIPTDLQASAYQQQSQVVTSVPGLTYPVWVSSTSQPGQQPTIVTGAQQRPLGTASMPLLTTSAPGQFSTKAAGIQGFSATPALLSNSIVLTSMQDGRSGVRARNSFRGGRAGALGRTSARDLEGNLILGPGLGQDVTVEDLLRIVLLLPPQTSAVEAVEQGLHCLDSSAAAALLKELSKQGQVKRAFEIFDWLRSLPPGHPLALLCDLYTYTTMIAQCGSAQQLRRALDLVAEMKARNITCNVHTYSALMNVCMKANELDVALEVFKQMQEEGMHPNLVTYNILIDVYVKKGQWDDAIGALDAIQLQGIQAEARTYNTVISACSKAGQFERALRVYQAMQAAGVEPSTTTYTAMIGVYGRVGQLDKCLEVYQEMRQRGCERNVITYSSLISACEKAGQWQVALELYDIMRQEGCRPNTVTFNSLIAACGHGNKWVKAGELFEQMPACGCKPDAVTYAALVGTYERCGQWHAALVAWELMQANGFHPDASLYHSLLEVLWQSGLVLAQVRALQLWVTANRTSQIRIYTNTNSATRALQYSMVTPKPGVSAITVLCWLLELRNKLCKDPAATAQPYPVVVTLQRARAGRADSAPSMAAHEAVRSLLLGASCPFQVVLQPASTLLTADSDQLNTWLRSQSFTELAQVLQVASNRQWTTEAMQAEDISTLTRCKEAYSAVCRLEAAHSFNPQLYNIAVLQQRSQVVNLALQYGQTFSVRGDTIYDGLALFDRVMTGGANVGANNWPLCLNCCLLLCARQSEPANGTTGNANTAVWHSYEAAEALTGFGPDACKAMEGNIICWLNGDLTVLSALRVLLLYQERLGYFIPDLRVADRCAADQPALVARAASSMVWLQVRPSLLAAGLLATLRSIKGIMPVWPTALQDLTGLSIEEGELPACMAQVEAILQ